MLVGNVKISLLGTRPDNSFTVLPTFCQMDIILLKNEFWCIEK